MSSFSLFFIGSFSFLISLFSFLNIIYSYYFNLYLNLNCYLISLIFSFLLGLICFLKKKVDQKISIFEKIITVIVGYIILPIFIAIPYYFSIYNIALLDSYFESISGFTSTGFTIFSNIKHLDESIILWRSTSQWIGGLYFLFSIIILIDIFDSNLKKSLTNFFSFNLSETFKQSFKILILYSVLTLFIFILLNIFGIRIFNSLNLSMSLVSSGGFLPVNNIEEVLNTQVKEVLISILMLVSYFSLFLSYNIVTNKRNINFFQEDIYLVIYLATIISIFYLFLNTDNNFIPIFFALTSSVSNIGISLKGSYSNLSFIFLILVIIGGSFFSTSSGLRFVKLYSLFKLSINQLNFNIHPKDVYITKLHFSDSKLDSLEINKFFLSLLVFVLSLILLTSFLTFSDINFEDSFKLSILTLMNTVNSEIYGLNTLNFQVLDYFTKIFLMIFMIIGRVELLTFFIIIKKFFFKN